MHFKYFDKFKETPLGSTHTLKLVFNVGVCVSEQLHANIIHDRTLNHVKFKVQFLRTLQVLSNFHFQIVGLPLPEFNALKKVLLSKTHLKRKSFLHLSMY